ncbi:odorant receptor 22c-like [Megachile rotundata]|uniref:odorant receptor 22c-like n=1 Tax=Megachile rotundata TaxID=143995 RepID=UPI003FD5785B
MGKVAKDSIDYYVLPNKILCSTIGIWPPDEERSFGGSLFVGFRVVFSIAAVSSIFVPEIMMIAVNWGDLRILTGVGCVLTTVAQLIFKMIYLTARKEKSYKLYKELRSLWDSSHDPKERRCYQDLAYIARNCTIIFYTTGMLTVAIFIVSAVSDYIKLGQDNNTANRHLPFEVWYGTDVTDSPAFEIAFACQVVASAICCVGITGLDTTCAISIIHICGQFRLMCMWISNIGIKNCNSPGSVTADLVKCIRHHQRLISAVKDVNNLLSPIIFVQVLTSAIVVCLCGFAVFRGAGDDVFKFIAYAMSMMIQLILWCWPGEILIQASLEVGYAVYLNVPWYKMAPACRRMLLLVILRSQNVCSLSALTFKSVSIRTLTTIFNTAASYFTLLRQMEESAMSS